MKRSGHFKIEWNKFSINSSNKFTQLNWDVFKCLAKSKSVSNLESVFIVTYSPNIYAMIKNEFTLAHTT